MNATHLLDALTMSVLNLCAAVILTGLHVVNAVYNWPNPFVTVAAPLAAAVFFVLTAIWFLELTRRARTRRSMSNVRPNPRHTVQVSAPTLVPLAAWTIDPHFDAGCGSPSVESGQNIPPKRRYSAKKSLQADARA